MRLLERYVLKELLKNFVVALTALTIILLIFGLVQQAREQGLGPEQVVRLIPYILPEMLRYTIPATILMAVASVYGRMSGSNEVVAIKSLGISPMTIIWPTFLFSFLLSLLTYWLNDVAVTWGQRGVQRVVLEGAEEIVYSMLRSQRSYSTKSFSMLVKGVEGRTLVQPTFMFAGDGNRGPLTVTAREAEIRSDAEVLRVICRHCRMETEGGFSGTLPFWENEIPLSDASRSGDTSRVPTHIPLSKIAGEVDRVQEELDSFRLSRAIQAGLPLLSGEFASLVGQNFGSDAMFIQDKLNNLYRLRTEPPRRLAAGFSCLCFVLIGVPVAIWRKNSDFMTSFFFCFGPILAVYYPLLMFGVGQAKDGANPYLVWLGNVLLAIAGLWLLRREVLRY